jgi:hypothetical protein
MTSEQAVEVATKRLPPINVGQFCNEETKGLPTADCNHIAENRKDPDSDIDGYMIKLVHADDTLVVKACEQCAFEFAKWTVARVPYRLLSRKSMINVLAETSPSPGLESVPVSARAKKLSEKVEQAKAIVKEIEGLLARVKGQGFDIERASIVMRAAKGKIRGKFLFVDMANAERLSELVKIIDIVDGRFVCGITAATKDNKDVRLYLRDETTTQAAKDVAALHKNLTKKGKE